MARARNIKPSFFTNEILGTLDPIIGMTFVGLWCLADKEGRLEDRPLRIKAELFPYREGTDINGYLTVMEREGFIDRYEVDGVKYIQVVNFEKHQSPHHTEKAKGFPPKPKGRKPSKGLTVIEPIDNLDSQVPTRSDSLIPDSLIPGQTVKQISPDGFEMFWTAYDKKVGKQAAITQWKRIKPCQEMTDRIVSAASAYASSRETKYRKDPERWLKEKRWEDESGGVSTNDWAKELAAGAV